MTHVGMVRKLNEDACMELGGLGLWAVADGMGGHAAGEVASRMVMDALAGIRRPSSLGGFVGEVLQRLQDVNQGLCDEAVRRREQIMGSTVVVLLAFDRHCVSMWAGDSRAYIYRDGELRQLTRDHSQVEDLVSQGLLTRQQAAHHPASNIITRAVGVSPHLDIDTEMLEVKEGDIFLLCTDGLYNEVNAAEITQSLASGSSQQACELLLERALARGARDNVTAVVVRAEDASQITQTQINPGFSGQVKPIIRNDDPTTLE